MVVGARMGVVHLEAGDMTIVLGGGDEAGAARRALGPRAGAHPRAGLRDRVHRRGGRAAGRRDRLLAQALPLRA